VQQERLHGHHPAAASDARDLAATFTQRDQLWPWQAAQAVRARNNSKWPVVEAAVVDMDANRYKRFEH
jgi:hypothetical protein